MTATLEQLAHVLAAWVAFNVANADWLGALSAGLPKAQALQGVRQVAKDHLVDAARVAGMIPSDRTATWEPDEIFTARDLLAKLLEVAPSPWDQQPREVRVKLSEADLETIRGQLDDLQQHVDKIAAEAQAAMTTCPPGRRLVQLTDGEIAALQHAATHVLDDVWPLPGGCDLDRNALREASDVLRFALRRGAR